MPNIYKFNSQTDQYRTYAGKKNRQVLEVIHVLALA